jgi:type VI secretion system protein ImpH
MAEKKSVKTEIFEDPTRFEFFQAVRLFEKIFPDRKAVGRESVPVNEVLRFRSRMALDFPASEVHEIAESEDELTGEQKTEMFVNFMGMAGVSGVLPVHYTELIMDRVRYRDTAMWSFLDIFTHRSISMFFRAWEKYRFPVAYERGNDDFTSFLFDFVGLGTAGLRGRMGLEDESLLPYSGLIAQKPHSTKSLEQILSDYFGVPAKIEQFFGQWLKLYDEDVTRLGKANSALGVSAIIGTRVWDQQSKFRIRLGGLTFREFQDFLPNGTANKALRSIVVFMVGMEFDFDVQLVLKAKQVPGTVLTTRAIRKPMLGWTSWLKSKPFKQDDDQVILQTEN